ncbi:hypothetical protein COCSUDRAFT_62638 [Coccomyxa subellipsoidea C-169]|uniref:Uncharacterized protein n=1 Tax=Coccomyxa subellipsoidea (strain C-169) TaxID=574566 RepID=I0Z0E9_COCSC|nr:hypothetical protein COCSUDRAFT_62638 [Coccomyxa subellipsoidea C-169]EIE24118.1 hypothetical protein COCSUDRAFT_62638 [Coccomyxa subellipsoidea C-169]|eukprot:XP_005648662.1 hypothetical protein COCSUDRAFT_62638 [Coccomyxa subellipsoidea C-169]
MLLSQEPPSEEELSRLEAKAMKAEAREAAIEKREEEQIERERRLRMVQRIAQVKWKRLEDARAARRQPPATR